MKKKSAYMRGTNIFIVTGWQICQPLIPGFLPRCWYILGCHSIIINNLCLAQTGQNGVARHPYHQEQVAVRAVALHYSHPNAGMKQHEYGRTKPCEQGSGQQELAVETYRVKTTINNNHDIQKTQSLLQIIFLNLKIPAATKYYPPTKMSALTKY